MKIRYLIDEVAYDDNGLIISMKHVGEVIRCKDCIHHHGHDCENMNYRLTSDDFYCGWAERREK